jgi:hypothetical protein
VPVPPDPETLKAIADATAAASSTPRTPTSSRRSTRRSAPGSVEQTREEITAAFAGGGLLLLLIGGGLGLRWFGRPCDQRRSASVVTTPRRRPPRSRPPRPRVGDGAQRRADRRVLLDRVGDEPERADRARRGQVLARVADRDGLLAGVAAPACGGRRRGPSTRRGGPGGSHAARPRPSRCRSAAGRRGRTRRAGRRPRARRRRREQVRRSRSRSAGARAEPAGVACEQQRGRASRRRPGVDRLAVARLQVPVSHSSSPSSMSPHPASRERRGSPNKRAPSGTGRAAAE